MTILQRSRPVSHGFRRGPGRGPLGAAVAAALLAVAATLLTAGTADAQIILGNEQPDARPLTEGMPDVRGGFSFCRLRYNRVRPLRSGLGWSTDYPAADHNFMTRLEELTTAPINVWASGTPGYAAVRATDPDLFRCPFLFMTDPGSYDFTAAEAENLRQFFLRGGFMWADDLWDDQGGWNHLRRNLERILPEYEIVEITPSHRLLTHHYVLSRVPQIPHLSYWRRTGLTSEQPGVTDNARLYAIFDEKDRLLVLVSYNTDFGDGWEREGNDREFFYRFSPEAYAVAINVALWIMTR